MHQGFATLIEAQLLEGQGQPDAATEKLAALASKQGRELPYDLARSLAVAADKPGDIFQFTALERLGWQAIESKDYAAAKQAFEAITQGEDVPPSVADRAKAGLVYIQGQASTQKQAQASGE